MTKDAEDLQICEEITKALLELPGAALFKEPLSENDEIYADYMQKIKSPQDLGTILHRLQNNEYANQQAWWKDVEQVWINAETYNRKDYPYICQIAEHMRKHAEKLKRKLDSKKVSGWMKNIIEWKQKLDKLIFAPPIDSKMFFLPEEPYTTPEYKKFSAKELDILIENSRNYLATSARAEDMRCIANIINPDFPNDEKEENITVNLEDLSPKTLYALREYFKKKIPNYPT